MPAPAARPRVRLATPDDGEACALIYAPYVTDTAISFEAVAPDGAEIAARFRATATTRFGVLRAAATLRAAGLRAARFGLRGVRRVAAIVCSVRAGDQVPSGSRYSRSQPPSRQAIRSGAIAASHGEFMCACSTSSFGKDSSTA